MGFWSKGEAQAGHRETEGERMWPSPAAHRELSPANRSLEAQRTPAKTSAETPTLANAFIQPCERQWSNDPAKLSQIPDAPEL